MGRPPACPGLPRDVVGRVRRVKQFKAIQGYRAEESSMCGIVGVVGLGPAAPVVLQALRRLEYRGYDSAGVACLVEGRLERRRAQGKLDRLAERLEAQPLEGVVGIGHTRWATHGAPNETNAHPHVS